jgi:hypothetical protein
MTSGEANTSSTLPLPGETLSLPQIQQLCLDADLDDLWRKIEADPPPWAFVFDGCSLWLDSWCGVPIHPACLYHDLKYWAGYPGERAERKAADRELREAVAGLVGCRIMPFFMYLGVRAGGGWPYRCSFSWGFGRRP